MMERSCGNVLNEVGTFMHTQQSQLILCFFFFLKKLSGFSMGLDSSRFFVKFIMIMASPGSVTFSGLFILLLMHYMLPVVLIIHHE